MYWSTLFIIRDYTKFQIWWYHSTLAPDAGNDWGQEEKKEVTEDEMVGWHHQLNGHKFEQIQGDSEGQGSLACCSPCGHRESDRTEWLTLLLTFMFMLPSLKVSLISFYSSFFPFFLFWSLLLVKLLSCVQCFAIPWTAACQVSLSFTMSWSLLKLMSWWCHPTISSSVTPVFSCP